MILKLCMAGRRGGCEDGDGTYRFDLQYCRIPRTDRTGHEEL